MHGAASLADAAALPVPRHRRFLRPWTVGPVAERTDEGEKGLRTKVGPATSSGTLTLTGRFIRRSVRSVADEQATRQPITPQQCEALTYADAHVHMTR